MELVEFLCQTHDLYIGDELSRSLREAGSSSEFLYPSSNVADSSFNSFYERLVSRQTSFEAKPSTLWSSVASAGRNGKRKKRNKSGPPIEEEKKAEGPKPIENPEWVIPPEFLPSKDFKSLPKEAIVSIMSKREVFLTKDRFLGIIPVYCADNFKFLRNVSPGLFDDVDEVVHRWVRVGSDDTGLAVAKGIKSIIDSQITTDYTQSGDSVPMSKHNQVKALICDTSCGFTRSAVVKGVLLKAEYVKDYGT